MYQCDLVRNWVDFVSPTKVEPVNITKNGTARREKSISALRTSEILIVLEVFLLHSNDLKGALVAGLPDYRKPITWNEHFSTYLCLFDLGKVRVVLEESATPDLKLMVKDDIDPAEVKFIVQANAG